MPAALSLSHLSGKIPSGRSHISERGVVFELWRQDDNGNRFLIRSFTGRAAAEQRMAELCRNPHKQIYWIADRRDAVLSPLYPDDGTSS